MPATVLKRDLNTIIFLWKLQNFLEEFQWLLLRLQLMFSKEFGAKAGATVSNKYQIQLEKVFAAVKNQKQPPYVFW